MKKNIFLVLIISLILLLAGDIIRRLSSNPTTDTGTVITETPEPAPFFESFDGETPVQPNNAERVTVKGNDNTDVSVLDFRQVEEVNNIEDGFYHIDGENIDVDLPYSILYSETDYSYTISLEAVPLSIVRERVSKDFLTMLGISTQEACKLKVYVGVTYGIDPALSGRNLGLSYCPDSVPL